MVAHFFSEKGLPQMNCVVILEHDHVTWKVDTKVALHTASIHMFSGNLYVRCKCRRTWKWLIKIPKHILTADVCAGIL